MPYDSVGVNSLGKPQIFPFVQTLYASLWLVITWNANICRYTQLMSSTAVSIPSRNSKFVTIHGSFIVSLLILGFPISKPNLISCQCRKSRMFEGSAGFL